MGYKDIPIHAYFDHLDKRWCRMDTKTRKKMRAEFYEPWNQVVHISKFGNIYQKNKNISGHAVSRLTTRQKSNFMSNR